MGWDAFGLPAENAAIEKGIPPAVWTKKNIEEMRKQIDGLNCRFNWEAEVKYESCTLYSVVRVTLRIISGHSGYF